MSYGLDTWCLGGLQTGRFARGAVAVGQALYRRLITPRGMLRGGDDEENYGLDISGYLGAVGYPAAINALPGLIRGELMKDERVLDVEVSVSSATGTDGMMDLLIEIDVTLQNEDEKFSLTLSVDDTSVALLGAPS